MEQDYVSEVVEYCKKNLHEIRIRPKERIGTSCDICENHAVLYLFVEYKSTLFLCNKCYNEIFSIPLGQQKNRFYYQHRMPL